MHNDGIMVFEHSAIYLCTDGEHMTFDFGNPTQNTGQFYENCIGNQAHRYNVRSIDSRSVQITNKDLMQEWIDD